MINLPEFTIKQVTEGSRCLQWDMPATVSSARGFHLGPWRTANPEFKPDVEKLLGPQEQQQTQFCTRGNKITPKLFRASYSQSPRARQNRCFLGSLQAQLLSRLPTAPPPPDSGSRCILTLDQELASTGPRSRTGSNLNLCVLQPFAAVKNTCIFPWLLDRLWWMSLSSRSPIFPLSAPHFMYTSSFPTGELLPTRVQLMSHSPSRC